MSTQMPLERANELHGTPNQANGDVAQAHGTVQPSHSASSLPQHAAPLSLPQIFSDLKFPTNAAHHLKTLGRGAFSKVKLAISRSTGEPLAVKIVDKEEMRYKAAKAREQRARAKARAKRMNGDHHVTVDAYRHHLHGRHHEEHIHHSTASLPTPHLPALVRNLLPEPQLLLLLSHRNIVRLLSVAESPSWCLVAMEYLPHGDLSCLVPPRAEPLSERKARNYFRQLLLALHHAHAKGVVHRDLKPENVMLGDWLPGEPGTGESAPREKRGLSSPATLNDEEAREPEKGQDAEGCWRVVVADFGLGRGRWKSWGTKGKLMPEHPQGESNNEEIAEETEEDEIDEEMQTFCGTPNFASPELVSGHPYDATLSDAWSLGVLLYLLLHPTGQLPFSSPNSLSHLYNLIKACNPDYSNIPEGAAHLLRQILVRDPGQRATIEQMISDPWVCEGGWPAGQEALLPTLPETPRTVVGVRNAGKEGEFVVCTVGPDLHHQHSGISPDTSFSELPSIRSSHEFLPFAVSRRSSLTDEEIAGTLSHDILGVGGVTGLLHRRCSLFDDTRAVLDPSGDAPPPTMTQRRMSWHAGSTLPPIGEAVSPAAPIPQLQEPTNQAIATFHALHRPASRLRRLPLDRPSQAGYSVKTKVSKVLKMQPAMVFQEVHAVCAQGGWNCSRPDKEVYCLHVTRAGSNNGSRMEVEIFEPGGIVGALLAGLSIARQGVVVRCRTRVKVEESGDERKKWEELAQKIVESVEAMDVARNP